MPRSNASVFLKKQPVQARSAATVDAVLEACAQVLEERGLMAVNTNYVARRAGVGVASLYQYFPSKETILAELIRRDRARLTRHLTLACKPRPGDTLIDVSTRMIEVAVAYQLDRPKLSAALEYVEPMLPIEQETRDKHAAIAGIIAEALERFGVEDAATAARDIGAMARGMIDAAGLRGEIDQSELLKRVSKAVLGYLGADAVYTRTSSGAVSGPTS